MMFKTLQDQAPLSSPMLPSNTLITFSYSFLKAELRNNLCCEAFLDSLDLKWSVLPLYFHNPGLGVLISNVFMFSDLYACSFSCPDSRLLVGRGWAVSISASQKAPIGPREPAAEGTELTLTHLPPFNCSYLAEPH